MISSMIHLTAHVVDVSWIDAFFQMIHVLDVAMVHFSTHVVERGFPIYCVVFAGSFSRTRRD
jgi:hypothetical protein